MKKIIFWGVGKIGKRMLGFWQWFGVKPDFFVDNSEELWGTTYQGIRILSTEEIFALDEIQILITCNQFDIISDQLLEHGICKEDIWKGNTIEDMLSFWAMYMKGHLRWDEEAPQEKGANYSVLFDLQGGFVLGGVEAWSMQMAEVLCKQKANVKFLVPDQVSCSDQNADSKVIRLDYRADISEFDKLIKCIYEIKKNMPCNVICNFPHTTFKSACLAKMLWPDEVNIIAIVHNDEDWYYDQYIRMREIIDHCLVTCDAMEERFIKGGMPKEKVGRMAWQIPCADILNRTYSKVGQPIRIGYAGRIVMGQKRMDLLIEIINKLKKADIDYQLELAGSGEYEHEMKKILSGFSDKIHFKGCLDREQMMDFWKSQDIGINCSDFEGRCISKAESMAAGAVPVITDTSSARDDVQDGYNGYVVPVGDVDGFVDRICYLYHHRELLEKMGKRSHQIILKQNAESNLDAMWNKILKR